MPHNRPLSRTALRWLTALLLMMAASLLISCGGGGGGGADEAPLSSAKDITTFAFTKTANPTLATDVSGTVASDSILLTLPYGQSRSGLVASYTALGVSVSAGGQAQSSGTSVVDFSSPVLYSVTAANGTVKTYTVTVLNALASAKDISSFTITSAANPTLPTSIDATVSQDSISAVLPYGISRAALVASFASTGQTVRVAGTVQTSASSVNNFEAPVLYTVDAEDGSTRSYTVNVSNAANSAKDINSFSMLGISASITPGSSPNSANISVVLPYGVARPALVATFASTGKTIQVAGKTQVSASTSNNFEAPLTYTVTADDASTKTYTVTVSNALNPAKNIVSFSVAGVSASVVGTNISATLPFGTDRKALITTFASTGVAVQVGSALQTSGVTSNDFRNPLLYTVTAEDGSTKVFTIAITNALVANASAANSVAVTETVILDGSASVDPNGNALTYIWELASKPSGSSAALSDSSKIKSSFIPDVEGIYILKLVVMDGSVISSPSNVTIIAVPTFFSSKASFYTKDGNSGNWDRSKLKLSVFTTGPEWGVNLTYQSIKLIAGQNYSLTLRCSNSSSSPYKIKIQPKNYYIDFYSMQSVKCDGQKKIVKFISPVTDSDALLSLNFGETIGDYWLDELVTLLPGARETVVTPPEGAIWLQQALEQDIPPKNYSALVIWAVAGTATSNQSKAETAFIEINYWKVYENLPNGSSNVIYEDNFNENIQIYKKGGLYTRLPKWFDASRNDFAETAYNMGADSGLLSIDVSQTPLNMIHWWTSRMPLTTGATYSTEVQFRVTGKTGIIFGSDWWRDTNAPYAGYNWDCTKVNNCEAWVSNWYGDTGGKFITIKVPQR